MKAFLYCQGVGVCSTKERSEIEKRREDGCLRKLSQWSSHKGRTGAARIDRDRFEEGQRQAEKRAQGSDTRYSGVFVCCRRNKRKRN